MCALLEESEAVEFTTWREGREFLESLGPRFVFRGHGDAGWALETSLERATSSLPHRTVEDVLMNAFRQGAHLFEKHLPPADDDLSWLALMQHYGLPTRLLDWTRSPHVAAYFAAEYRPPRDQE